MKELRDLKDLTIHDVVEGYLWVHLSRAQEALLDGPVHQVFRMAPGMAG